MSECSFLFFSAVETTALTAVTESQTRASTCLIESALSLATGRQRSQFTSESKQTMPMEIMTLWLHHQLDADSREQPTELELGQGSSPTTGRMACWLD